MLRDNFVNLITSIAARDGYQAAVNMYHDDPDNPVLAVTLERVDPEAPREWVMHGDNSWWYRVTAEYRFILADLGWYERWDNRTETSYTMICEHGPDLVSVAYSIYSAKKWGVDWRVTLAPLGIEALRVMTLRGWYYHASDELSPTALLAIKKRFETGSIWQWATN